MKSDTKQLGAKGESAAVDLLRRSGYQILARNFSCPLGELDIIAFHDGCIVFVEVKTGCGAESVPEEHVTPAKQRKLIQLARYWIEKHRRPDCAFRFDVVAVQVNDNGFRTRHIIEAFTPNGGGL